MDETETMTGAEAVVSTLLASGVDTCFANPGTSELSFVAALDRMPQMRTVLALHEGVATGAADGFGRMMDRPAATLLHLGPGLANGLACLHNARRARTPLVNIVGEHATYHVKYDAPLTTDLAGVARPFSDWVSTAASAAEAPGEAARAVGAAATGKIATLMLPADTCWGGPASPAPPPPPAAFGQPDAIAVEKAGRSLREAARPLLLLGGKALRARALQAAARIAAATGARLLATTQVARAERGAGRVGIERVPYPVDQALATLADVDCAVLVEARRPVAFFAYPGRPGALLPDGCRVVDLSAEPDGPAADPAEVLEALAEAVGAPATAPVEALEIPDAPRGDLTPESIARSVCRWMPDNAIIADDAVTSGRSFFPATRRARPHDWLQMTGGAIGHGLPLASGAAVACPDRKVICLQADGAGMYTVQALWTQAREALDITTIVFSNRSYAILRGEFRNVGITEVGERAQRLTSLDDPPIDWVSLARGLGVTATRADTAESFDAALQAAIGTRGPCLIEAVIP